MKTRLGDADWLDAAARLAARGRPSSCPNPAVGAIVIAQGIVVGRGWTCPGGRPHAEAVALEQAGSQAAGATLYVTLEPCAHHSERGPACTDLIITANPARVVIGVSDPDPRTAGKGIERLRKAGIEVSLADSPAALASLAGYLTRATLGRPHVTLKLATSMDGRIALPGGESKWITGEVARAHVHSRRAMHDAILVGGGTWRSDTPRLDVRLPGLTDRSPRRFILSRDISSDALTAADVIAQPGQIANLDGIQYLYVEGGAKAAASFLAADLVDRIDWYRAPILVGAGRDAIGDIGLSDLGRAHGRWKRVEHYPLGSDSYEAYVRSREGDAPSCSPV